MELEQFEQLKQRFKMGNVDEKINIYAYTEGLTQTQYKQLLKLFPVEHLPKLEAALQ